MPERVDSVHAGGDDPVHDLTATTTLWTRVNGAEAMPGVVTPLSWTFWIGPSERGGRAGFADMGVFRSGDVRLPASADERFTGIFYGRFALNVEQLRLLGDLMPGTSAEAMELQLMGSVRPGAASHPTRRRYPVIAAKLPWAALHHPSRARRQRDAWALWWRQAVQCPDDAPVARAHLRDALDHLEQAIRAHAVSTLLCQALFERVTRLAARAGLPGAEIHLVTGYGGMEETRIAVDLWAVSRGKLTLDAFLAGHGYHGPAEGELSSQSWRERPQPLEDLVERYLAVTDDQAPELLEAGRGEGRERAERNLLGALPAIRRPLGRVTLRLARRYIPLREVSKASVVRSFDAGRAAARALGRSLARAGLLADPDDVFFLTVDELLDDQHAWHVEDVVAKRQARHLENRAVILPETWSGTPVTRCAAPADYEDSGPLEGIAVSPGVYRGRVRLVLDPATSEIEPGEVIVCETTDPSWAAVFPLAGALVVDIGGPISHGAIVAREMGLPCVVNTGTGTRRLRTGDEVRVDGDAGIVEIVARAS